MRQSVQGDTSFHNEMVPRSFSPIDPKSLHLVWCEAGLGISSDQGLTQEMFWKAHPVSVTDLSLDRTVQKWACPDCRPAQAA